MQRHRHRLGTEDDERLVRRRRGAAVMGLEAALVRVRPREVRGIHERVEALLVHEPYEEIAERLAAREEVCARGPQIVAGRRRRDRAFEAPRANGRQLARRQQILDRHDRVAGAGAAREIGGPRGFERARLGAA